MGVAWNKVSRLLAFVRAWLRTHWRRLLVLRDKLRLSEETLHICSAGVVGVVGGMANYVFNLLNELFRWLVLGSTADMVRIARDLEHLPVHKLLVPALGGLAAGAVLYWGLRLIGTPGRTNLLEVVVAGDGRLPLRGTLVGTTAAMVSINTGASIGREGAVIQLCATLASKLGQLMRWPPYRLRLLIACGAASGIAACYNAPIAGAVFAAQIVLGNFSMSLFAPLVFASVIAAVVSRSFFGIEPWYVVPEFEVTRLAQLPWFVVLGLLAGVCGAVFLKSLRLSEQLFLRIRLPLYGRLALAGLAVGLISLPFPEIWGNGYTATNELLGHGTSHASEIWMVLGLLVAKLVATSITVGAGTVGGVFTPTMFLGAATGCLLGQTLHAFGIPTPPTGAFVLVGMAGMLAATTHSPLLAMIIVFELSLNYSLMPPLMLACVLATLVARGLHTESVYTEPLRRKGLQLERESARLGAASEKTIGDLMREPVPPVRDDTPFRQVTERFLRSSYNHLPVVDRSQRLLGSVALHDLKEFLTAGYELDTVIASDVMRPPPPRLTPDQKLADVLPLLLASELRNVPVVNNLIENQLVGAIARAEALSLLSEAIAARSAPKIE
ncbi:MAG: ClcB-like voltage-gated chloride channel protein [Verrucomicrobia bacterium]|nr:ClcB-like voltage-gated chloride channel protein [Verrucomicrobiota bacterium]